jgi:hypothetical protein
MIAAVSKIGPSGVSSAGMRPSGFTARKARLSKSPASQSSSLIS